MVFLMFGCRAAEKKMLAHLATVKPQNKCRAFPNMNRALAKLEAENESSTKT